MMYLPQLGHNSALPQHCVLSYSLTAAFCLLLLLLLLLLFPAA
jgi:hypothetical protein